MSLVTPVYGIKKCTARTAGAGYTCDLTCPAGYVFYDQSDATAKNVFQVQCDTGVAWSDNIPACANASECTSFVHCAFSYRCGIMSNEML